VDICRFVEVDSSSVGFVVVFSLLPHLLTGTGETGVVGDCSLASSTLYSFYSSSIYHPLTLDIPMRLSSTHLVVLYPSTDSPTLQPSQS
jgi:hypothetical protein